VQISIFLVFECIISPSWAVANLRSLMNSFVKSTMYDILRSLTGVEFGQRCGSLDDGVRNRVGFRIFNNLLSKRDEKTLVRRAKGVSNRRRNHDP
jgi:hypothetical protein